MFRLEKNKANSVTISVVGGDLVSSISDTTLTYKKLNTQNPTSLDCVVTDYNCFSNTITIEVNFGSEGGEFYVEIYNKSNNKLIYSGLMYVDSDSFSSGNNGIIIR